MISPAILRFAAAGTVICIANAMGAMDQFSELRSAVEKIRSRQQNLASVAQFVVCAQNSDAAMSIGVSKSQFIFNGLYTWREFTGRDGTCMEMLAPAKRMLTAEEAADLDFASRAEFPTVPNQVSSEPVAVRPIKGNINPVQLRATCVDPNSCKQSD